MRPLLPTPGGELDDEGLSAAYAVPPVGHRHVRANFAAGLDGAIEVGGRSEPLSSEADKHLFRTLRGLADVVLVGQATALAEGYGPVRRTTSGKLPPIALAARTLRISPDAPFFTEAAERPVLLVADDTEVSAAHLDVAEVHRCGPGLDLVTALDQLAETGLTRVLCEGGPRLLSELAVGGHLDELCLTIAPRLAGPGAVGLVGGDPWPDAPLPVALTALCEDDGFLFARYAFATASAPLGVR